MSCVRKFFLACCPVFFALLFDANQASAQTVEEFDDVKYSKGVSLGLNGFTEFTKLSLVDELGFEYDIISLLGDAKVRNELAIDNQTFQQMRTAHEKFVEQISILPDLVTKDTQDEIKSQFYATQHTLGEMLSDDQYNRLQQIKTQKGIQQFGLKKFLSTKHMQQTLGIDSSTLDGIESGNQKFRIDQNKLNIEANRVFVAHLTDKQQTELKSHFTDFEKEFLVQPLFKKGHANPVAPGDTSKFLYRMLGRNSYQRQLNLSDTQIKQLEQAGKAKQPSTDAISKTLDPDQSKQFYQMIKKSELSRWGTVGTVAFGYASELLEFSDQQSKEMNELGKRLQSEMHQKIADARQAHLRKQLNALSDSDREKIDSLIGKPIDFGK